MMMTAEYQSRLDAIYPRVYVDHDRKLFCKTSVAARVAVTPTTGEYATLNALCNDLSIMGYRQASRRAFEVLTAE